MLLLFFFHYIAGQLCVARLYSSFKFLVRTFAGSTNSSRSVEMMMEAMIGDELSSTLGQEEKEIRSRIFLHDNNVSELLDLM